MITLTITADHGSDLRAQLASVLFAESMAHPQTDAVKDGQNNPSPLGDAPKTTRKKPEPAPAADIPATRAIVATTVSDVGTATEAGSAATTVDTGQTASDEPGGALTYDKDIKPAILRVSAHPAEKGGGRDGVLKTLAKFNVDHASKVPEDQWPALLADVQALLEAE